MKISRIHFVHLRLSSPHMFQPAELRNLCPEMLLCLEGKGFVQPLVPSPLHQPHLPAATTNTSNVRVARHSSAAVFLFWPTDACNRFKALLVLGSHVCSKTAWGAGYHQQAARMHVRPGGASSSRPGAVRCLLLEHARERWLLQCY